MIIILQPKLHAFYQSLIGLVVIDAELDREDHGSIFATAIGRRLKPLDIKIDPRTRLNWW
jgi:hypothetical protein